MNIIEANKKLHALVADTYKTEPHYRPENRRKVAKIIKKLHDKTDGLSLIDLGCGQGFIIDIAAKYFGRITGVDITKEMTDKIDVSKYDSEVDIINSQIDMIPVNNESFAVCTAYAVLHHVDNLKPVFSEAYRILKSGGIFWTGLDPNYDFYQELPILGSDSIFIKREIDSRSKVSVLQREAEPNITGLNGKYVWSMLRDIGFSKVTITYDWFLGEAFMIGKKEEKIIDRYLREGLPMTRNLFKYISITAVK